MSEVTVPPFPESVTEGTLLAWRKRPGETVRRGEVLAEIETDKVVFEVPAPADGVLAETLAAEGATVVAGQPIARLEPVAAEAAAAKVEQKKPAAAPPPSQGSPSEEKASSFASGETQAPAVMPSARRLMAEKALSAAQVQGRGRGGRVRKEDVLEAAAAASAPSATPAPEPPPASPTAAPPPAAGRATETLMADLADKLLGERPEKRVPMTRLRARIAERLVQAQHTAAMLTTFNEINMQPVLEWRRAHRERFEQEYGVKLGLMSFFVKAVIEGLKRFPEINAAIDGQDIVYHGYYDIGIAVASERGLVVPILRDADRLSMAEIERQIADFAQRAQTGRLTLEEITGGTFTITNGGVFGSLFSTPILNPPQSAILGMHRIQDRPVAENGAVVIRPMMYVALTYDHRLIDGREAVRFLVTVKEVLEDPARLLLEI
jgi:2-oxoglutarate dehydrogenase E2 component (dihydrolipoamide succinyltransferase)